MKIHLDTGDGRHLIRAYEPGRILIGEVTYERSLILMPDRIIDDWRPQHFGELDAQAVQELADLQAEVVLLGTGRTLRFANPAWLSTLTKRHIGIECMDTGAACRTYNLLMSEGRKVVAGLLLADPPSPAPSV
ncbi:MAG TPA: Mth938-like domain-containing protein [Acidiferrobacter sp.]|nr:Mth938-like domain-containing protein [Acidiferrobacter sp.]